MIGLPRAADAPAVQPVLIANLAQRRLAIAVDEIINSRDAVVKTLGTHLKRVPGIWGATLMGDGTVVLILNPADLAGTSEAPVVVRPPAITAHEHAPYNVLVVDDSLSMRHVLSVAVKKAGWVPLPARDGLEALDIIQRSTRPPDLVLLDIEMPRMDGFEFLSTIRSHKANAALPIVMLTSRSGEKHRDKANALGATDYMVKPFQEDALIRNIDRLIQAARLGERRAS
jgi:chemosensory pili system protein ChpA (sensor histidine kinase/response regulator)